MCVRWIQHPIASGERGEVVWVQAEDVPHCGGPPGVTQAASHTQPVGITLRGYVKCQQHRGEGSGPGVNAVWARLPSHYSGDLGCRPRQRPHPGVKSGRDRRLSPWHAPAVPGGSRRLRHPIRSQR